MFRFFIFRLVTIAVVLTLTDVSPLSGGMPSPLPTGWVADKPTPGWAGSPGGFSTSSDLFVQAISFFVACLLLSAWGVKLLWNSLRKDFAALPPITYRRAVSFVLLWGLLFIIVLTMISGARELMTPGAWVKQGWTYRLADSPVLPTTEARRQALEKLRFALWQYAATHEGSFPASDEDEQAVDPALWNIPEWTGLRFLYVKDRVADRSGELLAFEPELNGDERLVLLTSGLIGTMRTAEIERLLGPEARE
jgi:hypothetical protein